MRRQVNQSAGAPMRKFTVAGGPATQRWWMPGCQTLSYSGESWDEFRRRITALPAKLAEAPRQANILAFTSATPTAILTGLALEVPDQRVRPLAGALFNASYSVLRQRGEHLHLFQFNAVPHLTAPRLRTHR